MTAVIPVTGAGVWVSRQIVARSLAVLGPVLPGVEVRRVPGRGEWVGDGEGGVVLYLHGSAYMLASARTHRGLTSRLSVMAGLPVFGVDYRLAPEHVFPAAADDVRAAYDWLLRQGYAPAQIVIAGDSAGGHLAVDLVLQLRREGRPGPAALVLFSPLVDLTLGQAMRRERERRDPMISAGRARRLVELYTSAADPADPRLAFAFGAGDMLPPTLIQAGGAEMLAADAEYLAGLIRSSGGDCELEIWPDQMHVFQALPVLVPEAEIALGRAAAFVRTHLGASSLAEVS
jgi:acetyl esterase/lipase